MHAQYWAHLIVQYTLVYVYVDHLCTPAKRELIFHQFRLRIFTATDMSPLNALTSADYMHKFIMLVSDTGFVMTSNSNHNKAASILFSHGSLAEISMLYTRESTPDLHRDIPQCHVRWSTRNSCSTRAAVKKYTYLHT